jgi:MFS family permease
VSDEFPVPSLKIFIDGIVYASFTAAGTLGISIGFVIGGLIVEQTSWRWVFRAIACVAVPLSVLSVWIIPVDTYKTSSKDKRMDFPGVFALTCELVFYDR